MDNMENMENAFSYTPLQYNLVNHLLVFGVGAIFAGLVYFAMTYKSVAPKYQLSSALSAVVMISAGLILYNQQMDWSRAFTFDGQMWNPVGDRTFSNGYRYVNWSIDVPSLLTQLLVPLGITGALFRKRWIAFTLSGLAMIWTGYVGQFYETTDLTQLLVWGAISSAFMVYICYLVGITCFRTAASPEMPPEAASLTRGVFWLLIVSWTLYPIAYLMPWLAPDAGGMVWRQALYTLADVSSKVVFGVILGQIALIRSAYEGYEPSIKAMGLKQRPTREQPVAKSRALG